MPSAVTRSQQRRDIAKALRRLPKPMSVVSVTEGHTVIQVPEMRPVVLENCSDCELTVR
jgi:hypothetical protein